MRRNGVTKLKSFLLSSTAGSVAMLSATVGFFGGTESAHAVFDRFVLVQPIQVCDDSGNNCAGVEYFHVATARTYEQANVLPIFLPLSQFNDTALLNSNDGPGDFDNSDGGSSDSETINMWFTSRNSIVDCGGPGTNIVGCAFIGGRRTVIDGDFSVGQAGDTSVHTGTHSNLIAHEMGHNFGLGHVGDGSTLTTRLMNPIVRTDDFDDIGVNNFLLTAGEISTVRGDSKAQTASNCLGTAGADAINLAAGSACLNILASSGSDVITLNFGSGVLQDIFGGSGNDLIALQFGSIVGDDVFGGSGDDAIFVGGIVMDSVFGGSGNDFIDLQSTGVVVGNVDGGSGDDLITIAADPADVLGGTGDDVITLNTGAMVDNVYGDDNDGFEGDDGNDIIVMNDGTVFGNIDGEGGNDVLRILGGQVDGDVLGGGGNDFIETDEPATVDGNVDGEAGNDIITIASDPADVLGGTGDDIINVNSGALIANVYGDDNDGFEGDDGDDILNLAGGTVTGVVDGEGGDDIFNLTGTSIGDDLLGGGGDDIITQTGGSVGDDILAEAGNDLITLSGGSVGDDVFAGSGDDLLILAGGSVGDDVFGGSGNDFLTMTAGSVGGDIFGESGNDRIEINGGTVFGGVFGGSGNDVISTAEPGTVFGNVDGGSGSDLITIASDPADVLGGTGDDVINIVTGAVVTGSVYGDDNDGFEGDDGNDTINLFGGFVANHVFGEGGDDVITLAGTVIGGNLSGDGGDDTLLITGGSVTNVFGGDGDDTATWTGGTISNSVGMGTGTDTLDIYGVNAGGTAFQAGLSVLDGGDDASSADGQVDTLNLHGVVEVLTDLQNWEFINLVDTSVGDLGQASRSIVTEQFFVEFGSTLVATGNFGSTQTYVIDGDLWNDGIVDMHDFGPSYDELAVTGTYTGGPDSLIRMDTFLGGPGSPSDLMIVGTATAGESALFIYDTNAGPGAYHPNGIPVVDVSTGTTDADHFTLVDGNTGLGGPIDKGLFFYDLVLRPDNVHVLVGAPDLEAFQLGRVPAQAQSAWHSSTGVWHDRTADLRAHLDGSAAPGPRGPVSPGFWMRGFGSFLDRDDDAMFAPFPDGFDPGPKSYHFNTSYDQDTYGGFAGLDWAWNGVFAAGDAGMLGAFGGYVGWKSRFDQQSRNGGISTLEASGASFGLYTTYLNQGFFVDGVFKADLPDIELSFPGLEPFGPSTDTVDARSLGGVLDAGYRIPFGTAWYVEGLSTLSYVNTDIDAASLGGSEIDFADDQSFRGRLGMGMGGTFTAGEVATVVSRLSFSAWHEFDGDNGTDIFSPGGAPLDIRHDVSGTFGEVSAVVDVFGNTNGLSFYVKADYRFSKDVSEYAGSIGLRFTP